MRKLMWLISFGLLLGACETQQQAEVGKSHARGLSLISKGLVNFKLPDEVQKAAPDVQRHLFQLVRYNSPAFEIKPEAAFLERDRTSSG